MSKTFGLTNYGRVNYLKNFKSGREMWDDPNRQCRKIIKGRFRSRYDRICATRSLINHSQRFPEISCNSRKQEGSWSYCWIRKLSNPKTFSPFHSVQIYISTSAPACFQEKKNFQNRRKNLSCYSKNHLGDMGKTFCGTHYVATFLLQSICDKQGSTGA